MAKPNSEPASRSNDHEDNRKEPNPGKVSGDGKDAEVGQGGKRLGPGHWEQPHTGGD